MLPHAGEDTKVWREAVELGATLAKLAEVAGSRVVTDVALVFDWQAWWATDLDSHPTGDISYLDQVHRAYNALLAEGFTVDIVAPGASLEGHKLVVVPSLYTVSDADAASLSDFVARGGHAVITFFSGIVDGDDRVRAGGYPGAFRELLGVSTEEFFPVEPGELLALSDGSTASTWTEWLHLRGASAVATFESGTLAGVPAVTRNAFGDGEAWYLATNLDPAGLRGVLASAARAAGVVTPPASPDGVEIIRRSGSENDFVFFINHTDAAFEATATGTELITDTAVAGTLTVAAGDVRVVRESRDHS
jgi:beta-galactosidase